MIEYILTSAASPLTLQDFRHKEFQFDKLFNNATFAERPIVPKIKKRLHPGHPASQRVDIAFADCIVAVLLSDLIEGLQDLLLPVQQGPELLFVGSTVDCAVKGLAAKKHKGNDLLVLHVGDILTPGAERRVVFEVAIGVRLL
ncbi:hypothetical protein NW768_008636 [Fusarium equiseti]|uniref:Uncharacterized protein n=1 Tax=Fusarium equiseti TaxID=61235 RepID=A0ABQ8R503_FUSEQ|nr:hypothetical protein NW768_008636 [Fusarium equiseti]